MAKASFKSVLQGSVFANSSGGIAIMMGLLLIPLIGAVGLSMDSARGYAVKQRLQESVDAAALAAAKDMTMSVADRKKVAEDYFNANWQDGYLFTKTVDLDVSSEGAAVSIRAEVEMPTTLMRVLGEEKAIVSAGSQAAQGASLVEVAVAVDNTFSLRLLLPDGNRRIDAVKQGAKDLVDVLVDGSDPETLSISLVPFSMVVNVGRENTGFLKAGTLTAANERGWAFPNNLSNLRNIDQWRGCVYERAGSFWGNATRSSYNGNDVTDAPPSVEGFEPYQIVHPDNSWRFACSLNMYSHFEYMTQSMFNDAVANPSYDYSNRVRRSCFNPPAASPTPTPSVTPTPSRTPTPSPTPTPTPTPTPPPITRPGNGDTNLNLDRWKIFNPSTLSQVQKVKLMAPVITDIQQRSSQPIVKIGTGVNGAADYSWKYATDQSPDIYVRIPDASIPRAPYDSTAGWTNVGKMIRFIPNYHSNDILPQDCKCPANSEFPTKYLGSYAIAKESGDYWFQQANSGNIQPYAGVNGRWILPWPTTGGGEPLIGGWGNSGCGLATIPLTKQTDDIKDMIDLMDVPESRTDGAELGYENTIINQGLVWAWRTLSPRWRGLWSGAPGDLPADYGNETSKAIVLLTDGLNQLREPDDFSEVYGRSDFGAPYTTAKDWWTRAQPSYYDADKKAYATIGLPWVQFTKDNGELPYYKHISNVQCNGAVSGNSSCSNPLQFRWGYTGAGGNPPTVTNYSSTGWMTNYNSLPAYHQSWFDLDGSAYGTSYNCKLRNPDNSSQCAYTKKTNIGGVQYPQYYLDLEKRLMQTCTNIKAAGVRIYFILFAVGDHPYRERAVSKFKECVGTSGGYYEAADTETLRDAFTDIGGKIVRLRLTQ
jgi:Flp pilus assembly protein TadG